MDIIHALLPNLCIGIAGVSIAARFVSRLYFVHVLAFMAAYVLSAVGVGIWFGVTYGTFLAGIGGFFAGLAATVVGSLISVLIVVYAMEHSHQRRHRLSR